MAGRLRLDSLGTQDIHITGSPTYSHFSGIFKKHTQFAFDVRENPLLDARFGQETTCIIPVDMGDLLTNLTLRYKFFSKVLTEETITDEDPFTPNVGIHAIEYADLFIGGTHIERLTGDWIYLYHKYHASDYNFRDSIVPLTTAKEQPYGKNDSGEWKLRQMYIDLPFYFYNNLPASVLLCKLDKHDCYVRIKFRSLDKLLRPYINENDIQANIQTASLLPTYAYLGDDELNYLKSAPVDQLITQMQLRRHDIPRTKDEDEIILRFQHPVKTMYFIAGKKSRKFSYQNDKELIQYMLNTKFKELGVTLNNTSLFKESFSKLVYENSLTNALSGVGGDVSFLDGTSFQLPTRDQIASYSFALYPLDNSPSGHLNFSRIIDQRCQIKLDYSDPYSAEEGDITEVQIYAKSYNILHYSSGLSGLKY
jgi:hypothetical protein|tara:strand:- start:950 stop:2218 length:1269 start_codon:yes stop_codon:yes gene_type:complete